MKPVVLLLFSAFFLLGQHGSEDPYRKISKKDVKLRLPKGFPKVVYDFSTNKITPAGFVLGRKLFYDPILSRDSSTSCGSCHQRIAAFGHIDHKLSHGINGLIGSRNVPALQNLIWQPNFMWDGGITHLDLQPLAPITNPLEMDETLTHVIEKLKKHPAYPGMFKKAFHTRDITSAGICRALSQFLALMISDSSRYDGYRNGQIQLNPQELRGLESFRSRCAVCHREPLMTDFSYRNNGLTPDTALRDKGRMRITGLQSDSLKFRVPSLRNVEITYPYMHDGRFRTLQQVLEFYAAGKNLPAGTDEAVLKNVGMSKREQKDLMAFLSTLTDRSFTYDRRFADPGGQ
jgi:cytochrome c peroxidase